jgi:hypothetical protein
VSENQRRADYIHRCQFFTTSMSISKSNYIFCISIPTPWPDGVVFPLMQPLVEMVPAQRLHVPGHRTKAR